MSIQSITCPQGHSYEPDYPGSEDCPMCAAARSYVAKATRPIYNDDGNIPHPRDLVNIPQGSTTKTVPIYEDMNEPVVGWLVAIEGPMLGQDFRLRPEMNLLGRDPSSNVALTGDGTISARQGYISYDPRKRRFMVGPGQGSRLLYRNGDEVLMPVALVAYDELEMGKSKFVFIPFCGERFSWDNSAPR